MGRTAARKEMNHRSPATVITKLIGVTCSDTHASSSCLLRSGTRSAVTLAPAKASSRPGSEDDKGAGQKRKRKGTGQGKGARLLIAQREMRLGDEALSWQDTPAADAHPVRRLLRSQTQRRAIPTPPLSWMLLDPRIRHACKWESQ